LRYLQVDLFKWCDGEPLSNDKKGKTAAVEVEIGECRASQTRARVVVLVLILGFDYVWDEKLPSPQSDKAAPLWPKARVSTSLQPSPTWVLVIQRTILMGASYSTNTPVLVSFYASTIWHHAMAARRSHC
jgi:hypothetical protein